jgi:hypothetical protein
MTGPELDAWVPSPAVRVRHQAPSAAEPERLWAAARAVRLREVGLLGRLIRWRIPGLSGEIAFDQLFRDPPFTVLEEGELSLVSGLVGRIWTLRRDYPELAGPEEFTGWHGSGTVRVLFANWVARADGVSVLHSEVRVEAFGAQGRLGLTSVRPLIRGFQHLIGSEALAVAVRAAGD